VVRHPFSGKLATEARPPRKRVVVCQGSHQLRQTVKAVLNERRENIHEEVIQWEEAKVVLSSAIFFVSRVAEFLYMQGTENKVQMYIRVHGEFQALESVKFGNHQLPT
jgi:hypothetical protein